MRRLTVPLEYISPALTQAILCRDLTATVDGKQVTVRRGATLAEAQERLGPRPDLRATVLLPGPDDMTQPDASLALAKAVAGPGLTLEGPHQGQVNVRAEQFGLLRVDSDRVYRLNRTNAALVATAFDGRVTQPGDTVAIVKAPRLVMAKRLLNRALAVVEGGPILRVAPFTVRAISLIAGTRIRPTNLQVASEQLRNKLAQFQAELVEVVHLDTDAPATIAAIYQRLLQAGSEVLLVAGSIVLDPQDPFLVAARRLRAQFVCRGAPVDPGTMFWAATFGTVPAFGLASCEMYGRTSILDLVLPYALAREPLTPALFAGFGYGGLLNETMVVRHPGTAGRIHEHAAASAAH